MGESKCQTNPALNRAGKLQGARFCHRLPVAVGTQNDGEPLFNTSEPRSKKKKKASRQTRRGEKRNPRPQHPASPHPGEAEIQPASPGAKVAEPPFSLPSPHGGSSAGRLRQKGGCSRRRGEPRGGRGSPLETGGAPRRPEEPRGGRSWPSEAGRWRRGAPERGARTYLQSRSSRSKWGLKLIMILW